MKECKGFINARSKLSSLARLTEKFPTATIHVKEKTIHLSDTAIRYRCYSLQPKPAATLHHHNLLQNPQIAVVF